MFFNKRIVNFFLGFVLLFTGILEVQAQSMATDKLPHFFPEGVRKETTPAKQWQEWLRYRNAAKTALANPNGYLFIVGDSIRVEKEYFGQKVTLVFDQHVRDGDRVRFTSFNEQKYISLQEFEDLVSFMDDFVIRAVELDWNFWEGPIQDAILNAAEAEGVSEKDFLKQIDEKDPLNPEFTIREMRYLPPKLEKKDFIPFRELHVGFTPAMPTALGITWLGTGVVYYTPLAMLRDYLVGSPEILAHEFVHANEKLQGLPLVWGFDAELAASIPSMLIEDDYLDLWFHPYISDIRELIWVYFRFNFEQARKEIVKMDYAGTLDINEEKFNQYSQKLNIAKKEILRAFRKIFAEFHSNPIFWTAMNDTLVDNKSVIHIMMASMYNPTILGGAEETMKWLKIHETEIGQVADRSLEQSGRSTGQLSEGNTPFFIFQEIANLYEFSEKDVREFLGTHNISPGDLFSWKPEKLKEEIEKFIKEKRLRRMTQ